MTQTAIILAGGLGTRLRSVVAELPKCMAPVAGRPFIAYVVDHLRKQGIRHFIFALGYKNEAFQEYLSTEPDLQYSLSVEDEPLGTGGAIRLACNHAKEKTVLVMNGDTLFKIQADELVSFHEKNDADCTLSLKPMRKVDRYGTVELNKDSSISIFKEKQFYAEALINGGVYALNAHKFLQEELPQKFSFEKDYLEKYFNQRRMFGVVQDNYFIDIGIPEDYERAQTELIPLMSFNLSHITPDWTLFLDRDGVINIEKHLDYVYHYGEFIFYEGAKEAIQFLSKKFKRIIVVTNQRGVGRELMTEQELLDIHNQMLADIDASGGQIHKIYYSTSTDNAHPNRKPNPGMFREAQKDFPDIDPRTSVMVGNNLSDMEFGRNAGMHTVFVKTTNPEQALPHPLIDLAFNDLAGFAKALQSI